MTAIMKFYLEVLISVIGWEFLVHRAEWMRKTAFSVVYSSGQLVPEVNYDLANKNIICNIKTQNTLIWGAPQAMAIGVVSYAGRYE
jgi:hypothetical protein